MPEKATETRDNLLNVASELFRRQGFVGTSVDEICEAAGVTKGAFFHHFKSKEALAEACLAAWDAITMKIIAAGEFHAVADPVERLLAGMDYLIGFFTQPGFFKSCLAGTTLQEVFQSHPKLRDAAYGCLLHGQSRFKSLLDGACEASGRKLDTDALAGLWIASLQGSLLMAKGSGDDAIIRHSLGHVREYIASLFR